MLGDLKRYIPLNWALLTPYNFLVVTLVVWIAGLGLALIFHPNSGETPEK